MADYSINDKDGQAPVREVKKKIRCQKAGIKKVNSICTDIKSNSTEVSVGEILKQARQKHKVRDLNVIAEELCIRPHLLEALELGDFEKFPSSCYATGFLKNYADYLGVDTSDIASRYEAEYAGSKECVVLSFPEAEKYNKLPVKSVVGIATLCLVLLAGVWTGFDNIKTEETAVTPTLINHEPANTNVLDSGAENVIAIASDKIRLKATQDVWVRLSDQQGVIQVEKILFKGEDLEASIDEGLSLMTNNAAALSLYADGATLLALGGHGEMIENMKLEQEKLIELSMLR